MKQNLRSLYVLTLCIAFSLIGKAQDEITNPARSSTTSTAVGLKTWDAPAAAVIWQSTQTANDGNVASIVLAAGQTSDFLILSNFIFNIPNTWTINQIIVNASGNSSLANSVVVSYVQLMNTPGVGFTPIAGSFTKTGGVKYETSPINSLQSYGTSCSQTCYWNTNLTPAAVNNPTFGLAIQFQNTGASSSLFSLDNVTIKLVLQPLNIPLPVDFLTFTGKKTASGGTQLSWKVADEKTAKFYDVEKSTDGQRFSAIGNVRATGDNSYTYTDLQPSTGSVFYRLKNVDMNDKYNYSNILSFKAGKASLVLKAFPMPVQDNLTIQHAVINAGARINITDISGRLMKSIIPAVGSMQTHVDFRVKAGMYLVRFDNGDGDVETLKVVKQ